MCSSRKSNFFLSTGVHRISFEEAGRNHKVLSVTKFYKFLPYSACLAQISVSLIRKGYIYFYLWTFLVHICISRFEYFGSFPEFGKKKRWKIFSKFFCSSWISQNQIVFIFIGIIVDLLGATHLRCSLHKDISEMLMSDLKERPEGSFLHSKIIGMGGTGKEHSNAY